MAGTEAKKIAPATNNRAQKGAAKLTGRRSFHAQALSPCRRITPASRGCWQATPVARWRHFYLMELTLSPGDKRQLSHWLSLSCRPHKFPVNLALKASFRQGTLGRLKRNFLIRLGTPGPWRRPPRRHCQSSKTLLRACFTVLLEIECRRADRGRVPRYARTRRALRALQRQR